MNAVNGVVSLKDPVPEALASAVIVRFTVSRVFLPFSKLAHFPVKIRK